MYSAIRAAAVFPGLDPNRTSTAIAKVKEDRREWRKEARAV